MTENAAYTRLPNRGLIHVEGEQRHDFLQNLVTNDLKNITPGKAIYSCLLNPQGKFLHDFFITEGDGFILLECEGGERAQDLYKSLNTYRLRADVKISVEDDVPVYAILPIMSSQAKPRDLIHDYTGSDPSTSLRSGRDDNFFGYPDNRHTNMGLRSFEKPQNIEEQPFEFWDRHRIALCIPDGSRDMITGSTTMDEAHIEKLNGVSYDKGCYVGQELTARMHYRGLGKKHLYAVQGALPAPAEEIKIDGKLAGEMRSNCGDVGLALLKDEAAEKLPKAGPFIQL